MAENILICGCGWLGKYLAASLAGKYSVTGTTRSQDKCNEIRTLGASPVLFDLYDDATSLAPHAEQSTVILNIPPGRRNQDLSDYTARMINLIQTLSKTTMSHLIFVSTTSVYGEQTRVVKETSSLQPETASARAHEEIEHTIARELPSRFSIVRLAGLTGPDRHPARSLAGRALTQGNKVVNLVHVHDVVTALSKLIQNGPVSRPLHLCSSAHPTRGVYYTWSAKQLHLTPPKFDTAFDEDTAETGKKIDAEESWKQLGLTPDYASPYDMLKR